MPATKTRKRRTAKRPSVVVRARVPAEKAKLLRSLAKAQGKTESSLLREAIDLIALRERRRTAVEGLIAMIPKKIPTKGDYGWDGRP